MTRNFAACILLLSLSATPSLAVQPASMYRATSMITLPNPSFAGVLSVESALRSRRSVRDFAPQPLTLAEVAQLLWAGQGITGSGETRTAPSAGAIYPLELYLVVGNISTLSKGVYKYHPRQHTLSRVVEGDRRAPLASAAFGQDGWRRLRP